MSDFLADFAKTLAGASHVEPPNRSWNLLLPKLCREAAGARPYVAALWIADDGSGERYTLWHQHKSGERPSDQPFCVSIVTESASEEALRDELARMSRRWAGDAAALPGRLVVLPLVFRNRKEPESEEIVLGAVSIHIEVTGPATGDVVPSDEVRIAAEMASSWLRMNRETRVMRALQDLQKERQDVETTEKLAATICTLLRRHANARRMCAIYVPSGDKLVRISRATEKSEWSDVPIETHDSDSPVSQFHFGEGPDSHSTNFDDNVAVLAFNPAGRRVDEGGYMGNVRLSALIGAEDSALPPTVLLVRVRDRNSRLRDVPPAIATLVLVCEPLLDPGHESIGGAFTQTHRRTIDYIQDYFRNTYALLVQRESMARIAKKIGKITTTVPDVMDDNADTKHLKSFVSMIREEIPAVIDAVIVERRPSRTPPYLYHQANSSPGKPPDWLPEIRKATSMAEGSFVSTERLPTRYLVRQNIRQDRDSEFELFLLLRAQKLSMVEFHLVEQVVAETRAELHRHLQRAEWAIQLGEIRHNIRSVAWSLVQKGTKVSWLYQVVKAQPKSSEEVKRRLIDHASFHKSIADLRYATQEFLTLTENIRTITGSGSRLILQLSAFDLPTMIKQCIGLFGEELERRGLICEFRNDDATGLLSRVSADRHWIHILLFNLIENAVKYTRKGRDKNNAIRIRVWVQGSFWRLEVANEGKFIPANMLEAIFAAYTRVEPEPGEAEMPGTGLGLHSVKTIVEMHQMTHLRPPGGKAILVESKRDMAASTSGLTHAYNVFRISIPRLVRTAE